MATSILLHTSIYALTVRKVWFLYLETAEGEGEVITENWIDVDMDNETTGENDEISGK